MQPFIRIVPEKILESQCPNHDPGDDWSNCICAKRDDLINRILKYNQSVNTALELGIIDRIEEKDNCWLIDNIVYFYYQKIKWRIKGSQVYRKTRNFKTFWDRYKEYLENPDMDARYKLTFGKYKNSRIGDVPHSYLIWLWENGMWEKRGNVVHEYIKNYVINNL